MDAIACDLKWCPSFPALLLVYRIRLIGDLSYVCKESILQKNGRRAFRLRLEGQTWSNACDWRAPYGTRCDVSCHGAGRGTPATVPMRKHVDPELEEQRRVARAEKVRAQLEGFPVLEDAAGPQTFQRFLRASMAPLQPGEKALPLRSKAPPIEGLYFWPAVMPDESASAQYDAGVDPMRLRQAVLSQFEQCVQEVHRDDDSLVESEVGSVVVI